MVWLWHPSQPEAWHLNVPLISGVSLFAGMGGAAIAPPTSLVEKDKECTYPPPCPRLCCGVRLEPGPEPAGAPGLWLSP